MSKLEQDTTRKSGSVFWLALVALIFSVASLLAGPFGFVPGLILGNAAFYRSRRMDRYHGYSVLAAASLVVGYAFAAIYGFVYLVLPILYLLHSVVSIVLDYNVRWVIKLLVIALAAVPSGILCCVYVALKRAPTATRYTCVTLFGAFILWACIVSSLQLSRESARRNQCINNMRKIGTDQTEHRFLHSNKTQARIDLEDSLKLLSEVNKNGMPMQDVATPRK